MKFVILVVAVVLIIVLADTVKSDFMIRRNIMSDSNSTNIAESVDMTDINSLVKTVNKYNKTIIKQKSVIDKLKDYTEKLKKENEILKNGGSISNNPNQPGSNPNTNSNNPTDYSSRTQPDLTTAVNKVLEYNAFYQQIELQIAREKELRESVDLKLREINEAQSRIDKIYGDINTGVRQRVGELEQKYKLIDQKNYDLSQRLFILEKEKEKEQMTRKMNKIMKNVDSNIIEPDCINRNSCRVCLEDPKCVWCGVESRCKLGDMSGPYDGSCADYFQYSSCAANSISDCFTFSSCAQCIANTACGWCEGENKCIEGNENGPIGLTCKSNKFVHIKGYERCNKTRSGSDNNSYLLRK